MQDVRFLAINSQDIEWDDNVTLFQLPAGAHKIHPNLVFAVYRFPPAAASQDPVCKHRVRG